MAKVKYAAIIDDIKGKIGNTVFQGGKAGPIVRGRVIPINPRSSAQLNVRGNLTSLSKAWASLTENERLAWDSAAASGDWRETDAFGNSFNLSGEQLYLKLNLVIDFIGETRLTNPPSKASFDAITLGALTAAAGTPAMTLAFTGTLSANFQFMISASAQVSAGIMSSKSVSFANIANTTGTSPINVLSAYTSKYGTLVAGRKVFIRMEIASDVTGETVLVGETSAIIAA